MVERSKRSSGATLATCRAALEEGVAANLAGGMIAWRDDGRPVVREDGSPGVVK